MAVTLIDSADNYISAGGSALELADSELEMAKSSADSNTDPPKMCVWVWAITLCYLHLDIIIILFRTY